MTASCKELALQFGIAFCCILPKPLDLMNSGWTALSNTIQTEGPYCLVLSPCQFVAQNIFRLGVFEYIKQRGLQSAEPIEKHDAYESLVNRMT